MSRSTKIINIATKVAPNGGASASCEMVYGVSKESAGTAIAKAMMFLNVYAERMDLNFRLHPHDVKNDQVLVVKMAEESPAVA